MNGHDLGIMDIHAGSGDASSLRSLPIEPGTVTLELQYLMTTAWHVAEPRLPPNEHRVSMHGLPGALWKKGHVRGSSFQQAGSSEYDLAFLALGDSVFHWVRPGISSVLDHSRPARVQV